MLKKCLGAALLPLFISACAGGISGWGLFPAAQPQTVYDLDLGGTIDGVPWEGTFVGSIATSHDITIQSKTDVNYFRVISCHRFQEFSDVIQTGWLRPNRGFEFTYDMASGIEDNGLCVLRLQAYSKQIDSDGNPVGSAFALGLFHNGSFTLPAENICNGADGGATGTSICKSMQGLEQRLKFSEQVIIANQQPQDSNLPPPCQGKFIDANTFSYHLPAGECMIVFASTKAPHRMAVHLGFGFTKTQYRPDP